MNIYFDVGFPAGYDLVQNYTFILSPKLISVSPNVGSDGGSLLVAQLEGIGEMNGTTHSGTLIDTSTNNSICQTFKVRSYGVVECLTMPGVITNGTVIGAKSYQTYEQATCNNTDESLCQYEQLSNSSFPAVTNLSNSDSSTIVFTGTNFFTSGYTAHASYSGIEANSVTLDSTTQVTAVWTHGMPPTNVAEVP